MERGEASWHLINLMREGYFPKGGCLSFLWVLCQVLGWVDFSAHFLVCKLFLIMYIFKNKNNSHY